MELNIDFSTSKLKSITTDPDEWMGNLEEIRADLQEIGVSMSEEELIIHIANNPPIEYESLVEKIIPQLSTISPEYLKDEIRAKYSQETIKI